MVTFTRNSPLDVDRLDEASQEPQPRPTGSSRDDNSSDPREAARVLAERLEAQLEKIFSKRSE